MHYYDYYNTIYIHANEMFIIILGILLCACDYMKDKHSFGCSVYNSIIIIVLYIILLYYRLLINYRNVYYNIAIATIVYNNSCMW